MSKIRVFISSTHRDLRHLRASLGDFVGSQGHEAILSERGDIAYLPDRALDESCYREVEDADIFVLLIGGRYGSPVSSTPLGAGRDFYCRYESISKREYEHARELGLSIYVAIENSVYGDFQLFQANREKRGIRYPNTESVNVFYLIELIEASQTPVQRFTVCAEIEEWLQGQWGGLFRAFLRDRLRLTRTPVLPAEVPAVPSVDVSIERQRPSDSDAPSAPIACETPVARFDPGHAGDAPYGVPSTSCGIQPVLDSAHDKLLDSLRIENYRFPPLVAAGAQRRDLSPLASVSLAIAIFRRFQ